jgi:hypothetical protein
MVPFTRRRIDRKTALGTENELCLLLVEGCTKLLTKVLRGILAWMDQTSRVGFSCCQAGEKWYAASTIVDEAILSD